MTLTLILVASVTVNIILLLLVNYISKKRAEIMLGVWKFKEEKKINTNMVRFEISTSPSWKVIKIFIRHFF